MPANRELGQFANHITVDDTTRQITIGSTSISVVIPSLSVGVGTATNFTSELSFTQVGAGATSRSLGSKLSEFVSVRDFGAVGDGVADDTAAIQAAVTAHRRVFLPYGNYKISSAIVLSQDYSALIGDERMPYLTIPAANGPAVKIVATGNTYNQFSTVENLILYCTGKPPYSTTPNSTNCGLAIDGSAAAGPQRVQRAAVRNCRVIGFSCGINLANHVNTLIERVFIEHHTDYTAETGYTSSNLHVGVNFDLTPFAAAGSSPQGSVELVQVAVNGGFSPAAVTSQCFRLVGTDPRDIFFDRCETALGNFGWFIKPTSADYNIDVHIRRPIIDAVRDVGIYVKDWGGNGALNIDGGYIVKAANNSGSAILVEDSAGVTIQNVQIPSVSLNNVSNDEGIRIKGSNSVTVGGCLVVNARYGISLDNSTLCTVVNNTIHAATGTLETTPVLTDGIRTFNGSSKNTIVANTIKGASATYKYSVGVSVESSCPNNIIVSNIIDNNTVTTRYNILDNSTMLHGINTAFDGERVVLKAPTQAIISIAGQQIYQGNHGTYPHLFKDGSGNNIAGIENSGTYVSLSDRNVKTNIADLLYGLDKLRQLNAVSYEFLKDDYANRSIHLGFIAQDVQTIVPEIVHSFDDGTLALEQTGFIPILVKALQELDQQVQQLRRLNE